MIPTPLSSTLLALSLFRLAVAQDCSKTCQPFGLDFIDNGTYFQNVLSSAPFTALQDFEGCQDDTSHNIFVQPNGDQLECSMTNMTPDDTPQLVTCPINKNQLVSGGYAIIVLSNNGQCAPIDYIRSFSLIVGQQATTTVPISVVVTSTSTPVVKTTLSVVQTITSVAGAVTTTVANPPFATFTVIPLPVISVVTRGIFTITSSVNIPSVVATTTTTKTVPCAHNNLAVMTAEAIVQADGRKGYADRWNSKVRVTIASLKSITKRDAEAMPTALSNPIAAREVVRKERTLQQRKEEALIQVRQLMANRKRAPDVPILTITNSASTVTVTSISLLPTTTITGTTTVVRTTTTTPTVTVKSGGGGITTVTAAAVTFINTFFVPIQVVTLTNVQPVTLTATKTATAC